MDQSATTESRNETAARIRGEDAALVRRAQEGDFDAFGELVDRHTGLVFNSAMHLVREREDAEDVVQTTFMKALEKIDSLRDPEAFRAWVARIAANTALHVLEKKKGLKTVSYEQMIEEDGRETLAPPSSVSRWPDNPRRVVSDNQFKHLLREIVAELPEKLRTVFVLRDIDELSTRETAEELAISEANVKVRLLRARLALREQLARVLDGPRRMPTHHSGAGVDTEFMVRLYSGDKEVEK